VNYKNYIIIVACPTYPDKFIGDKVVAQFVPTSFVIVTLSRHRRQRPRRPYFAKTENMSKIVL